ncbi:MAG: ATP-binding protein [Patescibacteria group bacterium]|nr:ATP-binding protein [Patescibacteria group bacterium]
MPNLFEKLIPRKDQQRSQAPKEESSEDLLEKERLYSEGLAKVLDLIAPSAVGVSSSYMQIGDVYCRTLFVAAYPRSLTIGWLNSVIGMDLPMDISMFIYPVDTGTILKKLRKKVTQIQSEMNIEEEKGLTRDPILEMAYHNVEALRDQLQEGVERFFKFGLYFNVFGGTLDELDDNTVMLESLVNARSVYTKKTIFRMKEGFISTIPLGFDKLANGNALNTSPLSTTFPFVSADVTSNQGILYGINRHNNSLILFDRFSMENANIVVFAKSGAGKSYAVKLEILRSMMIGTNAIIIDPEDEYKYLTETVGGSYLKISLNTTNHINPFDLPAEKGKEMDEIFRSNIAMLLGLLKLMLGTLTPEEESILEQAIRETYAIRDISADTLVEDLKSRTVPLMTDLYEVLRNMHGAEDLTIRLEKYTTGIFSGFLNERTNVSLENQLVVFNIRDLEEELRPIAMYIILNFIWREIRINLKKRLIVVDEAWRMMEHEEAARFLFSVAKRIRKYYGGLTTITQDITDFMMSRYGKPIVSNSSIQILMKQSQSAIDVVADTFYLTDREKYLLLDCGVGEGIFFAGLKRAAIQVVASYDEDKIITTDPAQRLELERKQKEEEGMA